MTINPAILAAMKAKSEAIQALRTTPKVEAPKITPAPKSNYEPVKLATLYLDVNPKMGVIEGHFDGNPTRDQVDRLVACGLCFVEKGMYSAIDSGGVRANLMREFGADFDDEIAPIKVPEKVLAIAGDIPETPKVVPADSLKGKAKLDIVVADDLDDEPSEVSKLTGFELFRRQTDELLEHFEMARPGTRPADLMLIAIDALHKSTFGRN